MQEFSSVTASSYDADSLAPLLTEKSAEGWHVVSIVAAGTNIIAYLEHESDGSVADVVTTPDAEEATAEVVEVEDLPEEQSPEVPDAAIAAFAAEEVTAGATESAEVDEPAGWAVAPESETTDAAADESLAELVADVDAAETAEATPVLAETVAEEPAAAEPAAAEPAATEPAATEPAAAESTVPAGWYADPSGRFELRYWDGTAWTEHVSRAGQQFTDPPVA